MLFQKNVALFNSFHPGPPPPQYRETMLQIAIALLLFPYTTGKSFMVSFSAHGLLAFPTTISFNQCVPSAFAQSNAVSPMLSPSWVSYHEGVLSGEIRCLF